jgi:hypothetical protein
MLISWAVALLGFLLGVWWNNPNRYRELAREKDAIIEELLEKINEYRDRIKEVKDTLSKEG